MKINILRCILIILLMFMFTTIFGFSNQDGEKSSNLSREITETVTKNIKTIQNLEKSKKEIVLSKIEHIIRKLAHFSLYMIVGILMMSLMSTYKLTNLQRTKISLIVGALYAISDEIHQIFIPDRTAMITDVLIDCCGVVVGIGVVVLIIRLYELVKN